VTTIMTTIGTTTNYEMLLLALLNPDFLTVINSNCKGQVYHII